MNSSTVHGHAGKVTMAEDNDGTDESEETGLIRRTIPAKAKAKAKAKDGDDDDDDDICGPFPRHGPYLSIDGQGEIQGNGNPNENENVPRVHVDDDDDCDGFVDEDYDDDGDYYPSSTVSAFDLAV
jgi:hypothetical protein